MTPAHPPEDRQPMPFATASQQALSVNPPEHPLPAMTTYELRDYRRNLETASHSSTDRPPYPRTGTASKARLMT